MAWPEGATAPPPNSRQVHDASANMNARIDDVQSTIRDLRADVQVDIRDLRADIRELREIVINAPKGSNAAN